MNKYTLISPRTMTGEQLMDYVCAAATRKEALGYCDDMVEERDRLQLENETLRGFAQFVIAWYENSGDSDPERNDKSSVELWKQAKAVLAKTST